jgi:sodium transport system permease protein
VNLRIVRLVYAKEMRETLRDRRTLLVMVLLPLVLYPLITIGLAQVVGVEEAKRRAELSRIAVAGPRWGALERALEKDREVVVLKDSSSTPASARARVRRGSVDAALVVPPTLERVLEGDGTARVDLVYDVTSDRSSLARERLRKILDGLSAEIRGERLARRSLPATLPTPIEPHEVSVARAGDVGRQALARVLPMLLVLMVLLGAFYPAIDLTAGEKERGTLEALLAAPVRSRDLLAGKFLVVATIAATTGVLNFGSILLAFTLGLRPSLAAAGIDAGLPPSALVLTFLALVPAALFFAALMVAVASLAGGFKEAQNLLTPIYLVCLVPATLAQLSSIGFTPLFALVPVLNLSLLARALVSGGGAPLPIALSLLSTGAYTVLALRAAARAFSSERHLFPPDETRRRAAPRGSSRRTALSPVESALLLLAVMGLLLFLGRPLQAGNLIGGILVTEWGLIALPVVFAAKLGRLDPRRALALHTPRATALLGAILAGLSAWYVVGFLVDSVQQRFLPIPREVSDELRRVLLGSGRGLALDLFAFAVSPAVCEELLFRGAILGASARVLRPASAVLVNGLLFGLFHLDLYRLFPTFLLGVVLAALRLRSGSIVPSMVFHLLNNGCAIVVGRLLGDVELPSRHDLGSLLPLALATLVFALGLRLVTPRGPGLKVPPPG